MFHGTLNTIIILSNTYNLKGLELIDRMPEELCMEFHDNVQEAVIKTIPKKKK